VLLAIGLGETRADGTLRLSVGRSNTIEQIDRAVEVIVRSVERVRGLAV
jgi:cysteine sulfinate desulfinase/cysteine desulfurase-like protein